MNDYKPEPPIIRKNNEFLHSQIFTFHSELPQFKFYILPEKFNESPIRPAIMKALREGIQSEESSGQPRYALNAQEIKKQLSTNSSPDVKNVTYTNLYFHLKKLLEVGVIQIVAYILEKNHKVAFYGRSARLVLFSGHSKDLKSYKLRFDELAKLTKILNPNFDDNFFARLPEQYSAIEEEKSMKIAKWMAENEGAISENRLNIDLIFKALKTIIDFATIEDQSISDVSELLQLLKR